MSTGAISQVNLAGTGQIPTQSQPGQRFGPGGILPGLTIAPAIDLSSCALIKQTPIPSIFGQFLQGGKFGGSKIRVEGVASDIVQVCCKASGDGVQWFQSMCSGVQQASHDQVFGNGLPRGFSGLAPSHNGISS